MCADPCKHRVWHIIITLTRLDAGCCSDRMALSLLSPAESPSAVGSVACHGLQVALPAATPRQLLPLSINLLPRT